MKFERGLYVSERAEELKGSLDDVYIIPAHREWGHLLYTLYKTTALRDEQHPDRKHGIVVVINHAPGTDEKALAAQRENAKLFTLVAALNNPKLKIQTEDKRDMRATEGSGNRFEDMTRAVQRSGVPIIPVYLVEEDMSVAVARHEGGEVARPLLRTDTGLLFTLDAETVPDTKSLRRVRDAFGRFPIDVAALQVVYDMQSMRAHEYGPFMHNLHVSYLYDTYRMVDIWLNTLAQGPISSEEDVFKHPSLFPITQTPGAGTVLTGRAYDVLQGWTRVPGKQLGEDVDIGHRAVRAGLTVHDFQTSFSKEGGEEEFIPALHLTTPRSGGRADGQGRVLQSYATDSGKTFAGMQITSIAGLRLKQALHTQLALYDEGWGDVTETVPADVQKDLKKFKLEPGVLEKLWEQFRAWDGTHHTQEHHDLIIAIRTLSDAYQRESVRDTVITIDDECRRLDKALSTTPLLDQPFHFTKAYPEWEYERFVRTALNTLKRFTSTLPESHASEDFALKHRLIIMHEYASVVRHVYAATVDTIGYILERQAQQEHKNVPDDAASRARDISDTQALIDGLLQRHRVHLKHALENIVNRVYDAHYYSGVGSVPADVWESWKRRQVK